MRLITLTPLISLNLHLCATFHATDGSRYDEFFYSLVRPLTRSHLSNHIQEFNR